MAERFFDRPGVAFTWVAVELIAFLILIGVATLWIPHVERIFRAEGIALSNAAAGCIAVGRSMGAYAWLLIPLVLLSLFVKAGIVHAQPAQARMVSLSAVACCAMVAPPRKTTPDNRLASTRQTMVSRSACGSLTWRPSISVKALSATPSSMPAKIRNSVAAKDQVNSNRVAKPTTPMPPTDIAHARSLRFRTRSAETFTLIPSRRFPPALFRQTRHGSSSGRSAGLTLAPLPWQAVRGNGTARGWIE